MNVGSGVAMQAHAQSLVLSPHPLGGYTHSEPLLIVAAPKTLHVCGTDPKVLLLSLFCAHQSCQLDSVSLKVRILASL